MTKVYVIGGTEEATTLKEVAAILGLAKVTGKDIESGKYPEVEVVEREDDGILALDTEHKDEFATQEAKEEQQAMEEDTEDDSTPLADYEEAGDPNMNPPVDEHLMAVIAKVEHAINIVPEDNTELFDAVCELEDSLRDGTDLTEEQANLLALILADKLDATTPDGTPKVLTNEDKEPEVLTNSGTPVNKPKGAKEDVPSEDQLEYPEVGEFKDEKAMKKYIKKLTDDQLAEWCEIEGAEYKACDHESINRMRMAMAIKAVHFPDTAPKAGKSKKKSKYADYATEDLVQMALDNDVEVPDDKGDMRICRMYTIMALRKAGLLA